MKHQLLRLALSVPLFLLFACPRTSVAQPATPYAVVVWGDQRTVPVAVQGGVRAIAAGYGHTVALKHDGSVLAWGSNDYGQSTVPASAQSGVTAVAAGYLLTAALKEDGSVVSWGSKCCGLTDVPVAAKSGVTAIAAGFEHTVALKNDGSVVAWGNNRYGQRTIPLAARSGVTAIAAGWNHTLALKSDGSVVAWGSNESGQRTIPLAAQSGVRAIAAGASHSVALKNDGSVVAWGDNSSGQTTVPVAAQSGVAAVAAGVIHTVALKNDGSVVAWGWNYQGQTTVPPEAQTGVAAIAAGYGHTVALVVPTAPNIATQPEGQAVNEWQSASFTVGATGYPLDYQWRKDGGDLAGATNDTYTLAFAQPHQAGSYTVVVSNSLGSVTSAPPAVLTVNPAAAGAAVAWGRGVQTPVPIAAQSGVAAIAAGGYCVFSACSAYTVALKNDGSVVAWGDNGYGQTMVPAAAQSGVVAIAAAEGHTVGLKNDGTVVAWGRNDQGQITGAPTTDGDSHSATASPVTLGGQVLSGVTAIAAGSQHTVALKNDGAVVAWGGCCGQSDVPVSAKSGVAAIAAGIYHTMALKSDGTVVAWGYNGSGQVTGTPSDELLATSVTLGGQVLTGVMAIAAGGSHSVALKNDGTVVAWGDNWAGQRTLPVAAQSGVTAIAAGWAHTVALKTDGTVVAWGNDGFAEVGPVTLGGQVLSGVTAIAAGISHTAAILGTALPLPSLQARPDGNEPILSWPTNAPGFTLQSTLDLTPPVAWRDSTGVPAVVGAYFTITNSSSGSTRFYRLRNL